MAKSVVGLFDSQQDAQNAVQELQSAGFSDNNMTFVNQSSGRFASMLTSAGIPDQDAQIYAQGVQQGGALIMLQALGDTEAERAADILDRNNVVDISSRLGSGYQRQSLQRATASSGTGYTNLYQGGEAKVPIIEEELHIGKREVETGGVRVNTRVEEVPVNEQVTLRDEHVDVHRKPVDRAVSQADLDAIQQGTFEMRETDEQAVVDKTARVVEEVHIKKQVGERVENIQDTVRRTDVDVQEVGGTTSSRTTGTTSSNEGMIEGGASRLGNTIEGATGADLDRDGDVGKRDKRNNY